MQRAVRQVERGQAVVAWADLAEEVGCLVEGVEDCGCGDVGQEGGVGCAGGLGGCYEIEVCEEWGGCWEGGCVRYQAGEEGEG